MDIPSPSYSHPDRPIRHSYPLVVSGRGLGTALSLVLRTAPFVALRLGLMVAFLLIALLWIALCGGVGYLFSGKDGSGGGGIIFFIISVVFPAGVFFWLRHYVLYQLKCGHVAVLTKLITHGELPEGVHQIRYGKQMVQQNFAQTNVMFAVDALVTGVAQAFNHSLSLFSQLVPIPGMQSIMRIVHLVVHRATTYLDETMLSYNLARGDDNVWRSSMDGLVYYAENAKPILKTAVFSVLIQYLLTIGIFILCLGPAYAIGLLLPEAMAPFAWIIAVVLAETARIALLEPILFILIALTFHTTIQNQPINESWEAKLDSVSTKFGELRQRALQHGTASPMKFNASADNLTTRELL